MSDPHDPLQARLAALFGEELHDNLRVLTAGLTALGEQSDIDHTLVQDLFRAAHSLKGAAHSAGVGDAIAPCRRLEELLADLRAGQRSVDDEFLDTYAADVETLAALDREMSPPPRRGDDPPPGPRQPRPLATGASTPRPAPEPSRARVSVGVLDGLVHDAGALVSATQRLHSLTSALADLRDAAAGGSTNQHSAALERLVDDAATLERELNRVAHQVAGTAQQLRMQPVNDLVPQLQQTITELCRATGKQARLEVHGGDVELDRDIVDAIREPLLHLVRNAVDHGIEAPDVRTARGKRPDGTVTLSASFTEGRVRIEVSDDGGGINVAALREAAGPHGRDAASELSDDDIDEAYRLAFLPGVSTAASVTDVSGRGIGLDAARARVETLGGTVQVGPAGDEAADGTAVVLLVPMTLAVIRVVVVSVAGESVALPAQSVERFTEVEPGALRRLGERLVDMSLGRARPSVPLASALEISSQANEGIPIVGIELVDLDGLLLVDRVVGEVEGLLQQLPRRAEHRSMILGAMTLPGDVPALVVNPVAAFRHALELGGPASVQPRARSQHTVLLVEDTLTTRALEHSILDAAGYRVIDAANGSDGWEALLHNDIDLVVSDVDMPVMGGIELCRAIRSSSRFGDLPVVLVTSMGSDEDRQLGLDAGANAYLVKSAFDQASLLDAIRRLL